MWGRPPQGDPSETLLHPEVARPSPCTRVRTLCGPWRLNVAALLLLPNVSGLPRSAECRQHPLETQIPAVPPREDQQGFEQEERWVTPWRTDKTEREGQRRLKECGDPGEQTEQQQRPDHDLTDGDDGTDHGIPRIRNSTQEGGVPTERHGWMFTLGRLGRCELREVRKCRAVPFHQLASVSFPMPLLSHSWPSRRGGSVKVPYGLPSDPSRE